MFLDFKSPHRDNFCKHANIEWLMSVTYHEIIAKYLYNVKIVKIQCSTQNIYCRFFYFIQFVIMLVILMTTVRVEEMALLMIYIYFVLVFRISLVIIFNKIFPFKYFWTSNSVLDLVLLHMFLPLRVWKLSLGNGKALE